MSALALAPGLRVIGAAAAEEVSAPPPTGAVERPRAPLVAIATPAQAEVRVEGGWTTAGGDPVGVARAELRVWRDLSILGGAQLTSTRGVRPRVGAAYQVRDPRRAPIGVRVQVEYKPEGFTEAEGEVEVTAAFSRRGAIDGAVALTYGQDPEGRERDAEAFAFATVSPSEPTAVGAVARTRVGLGDRLEDGRRWDLMAGGYGGVVIAGIAFDLTVGLEHVAGPNRAADGAIALAGAGVAW